MNLRSHHPDFVAVAEGGKHWLLETKGQETADVRFKDAAAEVPEDFLAFAWLNLPSQCRIKALERSPRTVWIFGAGASCHYNFNALGASVPLAKGFFKALNKLPTSQGFESHVGPLISCLNHGKGVT